MSMTIQQAIENRERCYKYLIGCGPKATTENVEAVRLSLEALKKQLPVKPDPENRYYGNGKCPICGVVFLDKSTNYCGNCGQALKWEE